MTTDQIIEVDAKEKILKGKTPRRILLFSGLVFIIILIVVAVISMNSDQNTKKIKDEDIKANIAKQGAQDSDKKIETVENAQYKEYLEAVKGNREAAANKNPDLEKLQGNGVASNSDVKRNSEFGNKNQSSVQYDQEIELRRKHDVIAVSPIFKSGAGKSSQRAANSLESELAMIKAAADARPIPSTQQDQLNGALAALNGQPVQPKSPVQTELDFNAAAAAKKFPEPTGIVERAKSKCLLTPGWLIPVSNKEAMNSDIPGELVVMVRENVYDSLENTCLAIPMGSKILITYNPNIRVGQERFNTAATILILPNGKRVPMMGTNAYDLQGNAGIEANVDNHYLRIFGTSLLLGLVGKLAGNDSVSTNTANGSSTTTTTILGQVLNQTASTVLERNKFIAPTLTRDKATRFNLMVTREFYMEPYRD
ncbi:TrbI/VirB10 family protein [Undibacterium oligocarboniphilum]|uniref:TrbI/VirB10 family protein n=1 Tax=Undibacterium oligocarboniphilum TaxID=666702 RepID=A0A850QIQ8_9BURK|nr:TrbI/VirB10 family protein [Undibacterium oligocarboniphilum]MBC3871437.1 TrbI/VirB10 family protein [Undibacterium oligocarboniphilum]NVO78987.1 TrbI/VirB10 family protein [Undibacterium oligocarboniphilum]